MRGSIALGLSVSFLVTFAGGMLALVQTDKVRAFVVRKHPGLADRFGSEQVDQLFIRSCGRVMLILAALSLVPLR